MHHQMDIIITLSASLVAALVFGFISQKMKLSPILGYLLAGFLVGPYSPGFVADSATANQFAEIGIILLMFGVGMHFHLKDLVAVKNIAVPGAIAQISFATLLGIVATHFFGWNLAAGAVFGIAVSVASTVVLTRVLADNRDLHNPIGHTAIGWLIVEDLFTIFVLVLLPTLFSVESFALRDVITSIGMTVIKIFIFAGFILIAGKKFLPLFLAYVARTGTRDLFTLAVLAIALGISYSASHFFGISMALGAFLAGMVIGQSDFSSRAAAEALPMKDAFAVLFFVSTGMLFDPSSILTHWALTLATLAIVLIGKPLIAVVVVLLMKNTLKKAVSIAVALAQIGEFSFIVATLGITLNILPLEAAQAIIFTAVVSIGLNPLLYKGINPIVKMIDSRLVGKVSDIDKDSNGFDVFDADQRRVIIVGYGPVGRNVARILNDNGISVSVIEMNIDTVMEIKNKKSDLIAVIHGDATQRQVLISAGIGVSESLVISAAGAPAVEIVEVVKELNSRIPILVNTNYVSEARELRRMGIQAVYSSEGSVAMNLSNRLLQDLGASDEQIAHEYQILKNEFMLE